MAPLPVTALCPVTQKQLTAYFLVYSPKTYSPSSVTTLIQTLSSSPILFVTKEFGDNNTHEHANFLFYHSARDTFNLRRIFKWKLPEWKVKAATSPNNVVAYMTKEGNTNILSR